MAHSLAAINFWSAAAPPKLPVPIGSETAALPANHRFRLDQGDRVKKQWEESAQPHQDHSIEIPQPHPRRRLAVKNQHLLRKTEFQPAVSLRVHTRSDDEQNFNQEHDHRAFQ